MTMQQIAVVTLGIAELDRARAFYEAGFGWAAVFSNDEIVFYQMNGLVLGLWLADRLAADMGRPPAAPGSVALAHNLREAGEIEPLMARLLAHGGRLLRAPDDPPHGGRRGYVADPDGHAWEIAWNPAWPISPEGAVRFSA
jgi:catechol 2,3-dioxygenase-like lactoylglutathione lyase family enzyme